MNRIRTSNPNSTSSNKNIKQAAINTCLLIYTISLIASNIFIGKLYSSELHWIGFTSGIFLWVMFVLKFSLSSTAEKKQWVKNNSLIIILFLFGLINWVGNNFAYSTVRVYFVESIYLVIITTYLCDKNFIKKIIFRLFIWVNLLLNVAPIAINFLIGFQLKNTNLINLLFQYTYMDSKHATPYSILYSNPNSLGVMTTTAILLAITGYRRKQNIWANIPFFVYLVFSATVVMLSESRASIIAFTGAIIIYLFIRLLRCRSNYGVALTLMLVIIGNFGMLGFIAFHQNTGINNLTDTEVMLNTKSSDRYIIWKSTYLSSSTTDLILGSGSLSFTEENRYNYLKNNIVHSFSYKDENIDIQKKHEETLDKNLDQWTSTFQHSRFSGVNNIYQLLLSRSNYSGTLHNKPSDNTTKDTKGVIDERLEAIRAIDTHNGYYSTMFCNGIIGLLIVSTILFHRIMRMDNKKVPHWALPAIHIILLNCFESSLVVDRYVPVAILFMLFAVGNTERKTTSISK